MCWLIPYCPTITDRVDAAWFSFHMLKPCTPRSQFGWLQRCLVLLKLLRVGLFPISHDHRSGGCRDGMVFDVLELCMSRSQIGCIQRCLLCVCVKTLRVVLS